MDSRKNSRNYIHQQHQQQHTAQAQQEQQQQQQRRLIDGRGIRAPTRILAAQQHLIDQEQHPNKPPEESLDPLVSMDTTNTPFVPSAGGNNQTSHTSAPTAAPTIERCSSNIYETRGDRHPSTRASIATAVDLLYMDSGTRSSRDLNPSSSSHNLQSYSSSNCTATLAAQPIGVAAATATSDTSNQQRQPRYDSPQVQPCDIKSLFECPICFDYAVPPIYQCQNGHLVCQNCNNKISHCPACRVPINEPSIRNLQLDKLANQFQFPCKYNFVGCQWKSFWFKKREHEDICEYITYPCPCPGTSCKWTGLLSQVMDHLSEHHKSITTLKGEDIVFLATDINLKGAVDWVMIQSCFDHHFLLVLEKQEDKDKFFAIVQLIGTPKEAENFKYMLELNRQPKRLVWEAAPRSILDGTQFSIANRDCLEFHLRTAQHFLSSINADDNDCIRSQNLAINVTIKRIAQ